MDDDVNDNEDDDDDDVYDDVVLKVPSGTPMVPGSDQEVITRARKSFPDGPHRFHGPPPSQKALSVAPRCQSLVSVS